jgi:DnaK suppressor protein
MTHDDLHARRADTERRRAHLEDEIARLRVDRSTDSADDEHDPEGVTLSSEWSRLEGLLSAADADLAAIDEAMNRADAGTYGICIDCQRPIPAARLEVLPMASRCVECAERASR